MTRRFIVGSAVVMALSACSVRVSQGGLCDGTKRLRDVHTEALLADGGDRSVITGAALIGAIDAGCGV